MLVYSNQVTPIFTQIGPLCQNAAAPLPTTSNNNITGTWNPATINTLTTGTTTYIFIPNTGQCAAGFTVDIIVDKELQPMRYTTINTSANSTKQLQARIISPNDKYTWTPEPA
ncbi:MAG: hypothetical protein WKF59_07240 [Chitinophagaceae bacterium]